MTTRPKGKLFALLAIFVAIGMVTATGAFTSLTAQRTVSVTTAGDGSADFLQFTTNSSDVAGTTGSELTLDVTNLNLNASTDFGVEFDVTYPSSNSGDINFYIADEDTDLHSGVTLSPTLGTDVLEFKNTTSSNSIEGQGDAVVLSPDETVTVEVAVNTTGGASIDNSGTILFVANTTA